MEDHLSCWGRRRRRKVGSLPSILHLGNAYERCRYAYDKIKRALATHGASLADAVKQVVYVTDVRYQSDVAPIQWHRRSRKTPQGSSDQVDPVTCRRHVNP